MGGFIPQKRLTQYKNWFKQHVDYFITKYPRYRHNFELKALHTQKVCVNILDLCQSLHLTANEQLLAEIMALFHDLGRFRQMARYGTFVDRLSTDHAQLGVTILKEKAILNTLNKGEKNLILNTIGLHNRPVLPPDRDEELLKFASLLRDADKLDIWRVVTDYYQNKQQGVQNSALELELPDTPQISPAVLKDVQKRRVILAPHLRTLNDFKVMQMGWVFDLNFTRSFQLVNKRQYLEKIYQSLPPGEARDEVYQAVNHFLHQKLNATEKTRLSKNKKAPAEEILIRLKQAYPQAACSLNFTNPHELLIAIILSAQCTDKQVNKVTPRLFSQFKSPQEFAAAPLEYLSKIIRPTGFYRNKARSIKYAMQAIVEKHGGQIPDKIEDLVALPGVGRKTANVVLGNAFDTPGVVVDTHVQRLSRRLGLTGHKNPGKIEQNLMNLFPRSEWTLLGHLLIEHGRAICRARRPLCSKCLLNDICPSAKF